MEGTLGCHDFFSVDGSEDYHMNTASACLPMRSLSALYYLERKRCSCDSYALLSHAPTIGRSL